MPAVMPAMRVSESGYCRADPMSPRERKGTKARMVVSEVMTMGLSRWWLAITTERSNEWW